MPGAGGDPSGGDHTGGPTCTATVSAQVTRSCNDTESLCEPASSSCCGTILIPGGSFMLGGAVETPSVSAALSSFRLDRYEVTVGRFRSFLGEYDAWRSDGNPTECAGEHPRIPGSGWLRLGWDTFLPDTAVEFEERVLICGQSTGWATLEREAKLPMNCVSWYEAFAFCIWDGGRLPTEAEWEYAASGGSEQRPYPWGSSPMPGNKNVVFGASADGRTGPSRFDILPVGSRPLGVGLFGHLDLAGSMFEWVRDSYGQYADACVDCAKLDGPDRVARGGSWGAGTTYLLSTTRTLEFVAFRRADLGFRCAR